MADNMICRRARNNARRNEIISYIFIGIGLFICVAAVWAAELLLK